MIVPYPFCRVREFLRQTSRLDRWTRECNRLELRIVRRTEESTDRYGRMSTLGQIERDMVVRLIQTHDCRCCSRLRDSRSTSPEWFSSTKRCIRRVIFDLWSLERGEISEDWWWNFVRWRTQEEGNHSWDQGKRRRGRKERSKISGR